MDNTFDTDDSEQHYKSYKDAYHTLASRVEAEEDLEISKEPHKASCRYDLAQLDDDNIPELAVIDDKGRKRFYTYKDEKLQNYDNSDKQGEVEYKYTYPELEKKLGYGSDKVSLLYDAAKDSDKTKISFLAGKRDYTFEFEEESAYHIKTALSDQQQTVTEDYFVPISKLYLVEKADDTAFLVVINKDNHLFGSIYVYNLSAEGLTGHREFGEDYVYCEKKIQDPMNIELWAVSDLIGITVVKKNFYIDSCGYIKSPDDCAYYIQNSALYEGKPASSKGETMTTKIELELEASRDPDDEDSLETVTVPKGTKVTFYKLKDNNVYFLLHDGKQFVITMDDADETSDESLPTIEEIFDEIPEW